MGLSKISFLKPLHRGYSTRGCFYQLTRDCHYPFERESAWCQIQKDNWELFWLSSWKRTVKLDEWYGIGAIYWTSEKRVFWWLWSLLWLGPSKDGIIMRIQCFIHCGFWSHLIERTIDPQKTYWLSQFLCKFFNWCRSWRRHRNYSSTSCTGRNLLLYQQ